MINQLTTLKDPLTWGLLVGTALLLWHPALGIIALIAFVLGAALSES